MNKLHTIPAADGFRMPGEFEPHRGCIMIWPKRPGSWNYGAKKAREAFKRVAWAIAESEEVFMLAEPDVEENAREMLAGNPGHEIHVIRMESDDAWARDVAPTFVVNGEGAVRGIDWEFNAWGGTVDGLYAHWEKDDAFAGGLLAVRRCGSRALIVGLTTGGVLFLLLLTIGALCFETVSLEAGGIGLLCGSLCGGAAAGILGGGGKKKPARKKRRK